MAERSAQEPPFTVAMFRTLGDMLLGPVTSLPSGHYQGQGEHRLLIRRRTVQALYVRHLIDETEIEPGKYRAEVNRIGRAFYENHPLYRQMAASVAALSRAKTLVPA